MLKPRSPQRSFLDTDVLVEPLLPQESFYRAFRMRVWPLIQDQDFETLYCGGNGRPAISPALLARVLILQFHENHSDREMEAACQYDLRLKYALGLRIDERPFDHSSLGNFRDRLLRHAQEKAIFDRILGTLIAQGLIAKDEPQRIDATHVIADIAVPGMTALVQQGTRAVLKPLARRHSKIHQRLAQQIHHAPLVETENPEPPAGRPDDASRARGLVQAVQDARVVLEGVASLPSDPLLKQRVALLKRILQENIEESEPGTPREKAPQHKPKDLLVSPIDSDARYGAKSRTKHFTGYKANVTETVTSRFITHIQAMRGNRPDGETMVEAVRAQGAHGLKPSKVIGDTAYGDGAYREALGQEGIQVVAPLRPANPRTAAVYPKRAFQHHPQENTLTCPNGVTVKPHYFDRRNARTTFRFPMRACQSCAHQPRCTQASEGQRTVGISPGNAALRAAEQYNQTPPFRDDMRLRPPIEGKLSELVRYHGMRRARYRGLQKLGLQLYCTAAAVNLKHWIKGWPAHRPPCASPVAGI